MKNRKKIIIIISLFLLYITACGDTKIVSFNTNGGSNIKTQEVETNEKVTKPTDPTKTGFIFDYWEYNGQEYDFNAPVKGDMTLNAVWKNDKYKVTFVLDGNKKTVEVSDLSEIDLDGLLFPEKSGYVIKWYIDGFEFDYSRPLTSDLIVTGKYVGTGSGRVSVTGVSLNTTSMTLNVGGAESLTETVRPSNATNASVSWSSSNSSVVYVDNNGNVTAKAEGEAIITVITNDGGKKATCKITVKKEKAAKVAVKGVTLNKTTATVSKNNTITLKATINPTNATNKNVTWSSSNTNVAKVDSNGKVKGVGTGTATITVKTKDGNKKATCKITVKNVSVKGVSLNKTSLSLLQNKTETLVATLNPTNASNKKLTWTSSNTKVATVDSNGQVKGIGSGTATITVKTKDGNKKATCKVMVRVVAVKSVTLNKTSTTILKGSTEILLVKVTPNDATSKKITWTSSNKNVATVDSNGQVKGVGNGTATITAKTSNGKKATCTVTVKKVEPTGITLNKTSITVVQGKTETLKASFTPNDTTEKKVTWTSSNKNVATVDSKGNVKGVAKGTATITAKTSNGKKATCKVTVQTVSVTGVSLNKTSATISKGKTVTLTATVAPSNASNKNVTWTSSNKNIAIVDSKGTVKGIAKGKATITVKTKNGGKTAKCVVTVK